MGYNFPEYSDAVESMKALGLAQPFKLSRPREGKAID